MNRPARADLDRGLTVAEAARALGMSQCWVRRAVTKGELRAYRAGRAVRVLESAIMAYRAARPAATEPGAPVPARRAAAGRLDDEYWRAVAALEKDGLL